MDSLAAFLGLALLALEVGVSLFPVLAGLGITGLAVAGVAAAVRPAPLRGRWPWLLAPSAVAPALLAYGVAFAASDPPGPVGAWHPTVLAALFWFHVPIGLALVIVFRRNPLVPLGLSAFQMWLSFGAACVASMAVTGVWL